MRLQRRAGLPGAQDFPVLPDLLDRIIGRGLLDRAAERFKHLQRRLAEIEDPWLERQMAAEVAGPGDARALEVALERPCELRRILPVRQRRARIVAGLHRQQRREIGHVPRHRAGRAHDGVERVRAHWPARGRTTGESRTHCCRRPDCGASRRDRCRRRPAACAARPRRRRRRSSRRRSCSGRRC